MSHEFLTVHILFDLPHHARNRDDRGAPKSQLEGGVLRGLLSSASLKRAARERFERDAAAVNKSIRSRELGEHILDRAEQIAADASLPFDRKAAEKAVKPVLRKLTVNADKADKAEDKKTADARAAHERKAPAGSTPEQVEEYMAVYDAKVAKKNAASDDAEKESDTPIWLSGEEIEALAVALAKSDLEDLDQVFQFSTASLAIAGFGRMFAHQPGLSTDAAIAVSPATTTHSIVIEFDPFTAVDDLVNTGAAHLNQQAHTNGVYYRNITFDRRQLAASWTGLSRDDVREALSQFVRLSIETVPQGRKNSSSAETLPAVIIAEPQLHRVGYQFEKPIQAESGGGFLNPSIDALYAQANASRAYDPEFFGPTIVSGTTAVGNESQVAGATVAPVRSMVSDIVDWLLEK